MKNVFRYLAISLFASLLTISTASAVDAPDAMVPGDLADGETFYVVFVTSVQTNATSTDITDYDAFVNAVADTSNVKETDVSSVTWKALGSTGASTQSLFLFSDNASRPIYNLNGERVANDRPDLFDGTLLRDIRFAENGQPVCDGDDFVWTGLEASGASSAGNELGTATPTYGNCKSTTATWLDRDTQAAGTNAHVYAVSPLLTVVINDPPTLTATSNDPTVVTNSSAQALFSNAAVDTIEGGQAIIATEVVVENVTNGGAEILNADGSSIALFDGNSGNTSTNALNFIVTIVGTTATIQFDGGSLTANETKTLVDAASYEVTNALSEAGTRTVTITSLTDSGGSANGGNDTAVLAVSSQVTIKIDTDADGIPNDIDLDDDNDGVSDAVEIQDGTDPLAADSFVERNGQTVCINWNGFLDFLTQILEIRNTSGAPIKVDTNFFSIDGIMQDSVRLNLDSGQQFDVILNDLNGFIPNSYGRVCAVIVSGQSDAVNGQLLYYSLDNGTFKLALVEPLGGSRTGRQFMTSNTFFPSLNAAQIGDVLTGFVQIANEEDIPADGNLIFYDQEGDTLRTERVKLGAKERRDIDIHSIGGNRTGLLVWEPDETNTRFRVTQNRYFFGAIFDFSGLVAATAVPARRATGQKLVAPFDTRDRLAVIEISNTLDEDVDVTVEMLNDAGVPAVSPNTFTLNRRGTIHFVLNSFVDDSVGTVTVSGAKPFSLLSNIFEYGINEFGLLEFVSVSNPTEGAGAALAGSYNNFLGTCSLRLASKSPNAEQVTVRMTRFDTTVLMNDVPFSIPAGGAITVDVCAEENQLAYGEIRVTPTNVGKISGQIERLNADASVAFAVPLRAQ